MHKKEIEEFEVMDKEKIAEACDWLVFYDINRYFPFQKKKILITLSGDVLSKISKISNKSSYINNLILNNH